MAEKQTPCLNCELPMRMIRPGETKPVCGNRRCNAFGKAAHSKDGRKQLCYKCGKYCRRTLNMCPTCVK
jgi:hypothetical protein